MDSIAILLASLRRGSSHRSFVIKLIDELFEEIVRAVERNDFKESQRRVLIMKFLAECYNYKVIDTDTLFTILYKLINYDLEQRAEDEYMKQLDSVAESFRIRLVCTLVDSLGKYFQQRGERKKLMDRFLIFFSRFIFSKNYVLMDLEFMILDTLDNVRPRFQKFKAESEAAEACTLIEAAESAGRDIQPLLRQYMEGGEDYDDYGADYSKHNDDYYYDEYGYEQKEEKEGAERKGEEQQEEDEMLEPLDEEVSKQQIKEQRELIMNEQEKQEMNAFELEFNSLIQESANQARKEGGNILSHQRKEILIPLAQLKNKINTTNSSTLTGSTTTAENRPSQPNLTMGFSLISKKGNKTNIR